MWLYSLSFYHLTSYIKMQLRSGKIIYMSNKNAKLVLNESTNYVMKAKSISKKGKCKVENIVKHCMVLRSAKTHKSATYCNNLGSLSHFSANASLQLFKDWLVSRLKSFANEFNKYDTYGYRERVLERTRLVVEMVAFLRDHIDYIMSSSEFYEFSLILYTKLYEFKTDITAMLNRETKDDDEFNNRERAILGYARVDIIKLAAIMESINPTLCNFTTLHL